MRQQSNSWISLTTTALVSNIKPILSAATGALASRASGAHMCSRNCESSDNLVTRFIETVI